MTIGPPIPEMQFDLENSRSKAKVKGTLFNRASSCLISFLFHINWTNHSWDMANRIFGCGKQILNFNRWKTWQGGYTNQVLSRLDEQFSLYCAYKLNSLLLWQLNDLDSRWLRWVPKISHTHRLTMCVRRKYLQGFFWKVEKCWQNGGSRNRPKLTNPPAIQGDLTTNCCQSNAHFSYPHPMYISQSRGTYQRLDNEDSYISSLSLQGKIGFRLYYKWFWHG